MGCRRQSSYLLGKGIYLPAWNGHAALLGVLLCTEFATFLEPIMHAMSILIPLSTALAALLLDLHNAPLLGVGCYIASYPMGYDLDPQLDCTRGQSADAFIWRFSASIAIPCFLIVLFSMALLLRKVRVNSQNIQRRYTQF